MESSPDDSWDMERGAKKMDESGGSEEGARGSGREADGAEGGAERVPEWRRRNTARHPETLFTRTEYWSVSGKRERQAAKRYEGGGRQEFGGAKRGYERRNKSEIFVTKGKFHTGAARAPLVRRLGINTLEELAEKDPSEVAISLSSHPSLKDLLSDTNMNQDLTEILCLVLSKAFKSRTDRSTLQHLAAIIKDSGFFRTNLPHYLGGMGSESNDLRRARYPIQLENILAILSEVLSIYPASSVQTVSVLVTLIQVSINSLKASGVDFKPQIEETLERVQAQIRHLQQRSREGSLRSDRDSYALLPADEEALQNFRTIPIYPTPEEFQETERPFLRPNFTSQRYTNTHIYLDTHFRLLREDFVRPLREGIQQLLREQREMGANDNPLRSKRFDDIRVYFKTVLVAPKCTMTGLAYLVQFDIRPLQFVHWENSKRLIYGSLVCLSCDNFKSFLFATVSDRDPKELRNGQVQITFTEESRIKLARIQREQPFLMVETTAYFEAYRYVLEGLQEQEEDELPFQRYIVECNKDVQPPAYLLEDDEYDLSCLVDLDHKNGMEPFRSLDPNSWPKMEDLELDESQMRAFQLALTKKLAIIQGPPGTGKTHVGLKIAQALLKNHHLWADGDDSGPMLVVCYTNHALDQFLEGIHKFLRHGIVRVGGRSNSELLKSFNLNELTHTHTFRMNLSSHLRTAHTNVYEDACDERSELEKHSLKLQCSQKGVLREILLQEFISNRHWDSLQEVHRYFDNQKSCVMMEWLGLGSTGFQQEEPENKCVNEVKEVLQVESNALIDIEEEADQMQAERFIEDDGFDPRGGRQRRKEDEMAEAVRLKEVEGWMLAMNLDEADTEATQNAAGFQVSMNRKKIRQTFKRELEKTSTMTEEEEDAVMDVWTLRQEDKWRLYRLWVARYRVKLHTEGLELEEAFQNAVDRLADIKRQESLCVLKRAKVIGMTSTGAAKYRRALQEVRPRLVIIEEAAEVLEAHTITTLSKDCQHLILIGDHQQLRPSATVYELAKSFNLEISMFERLVKMELPFVRLNYQHRMRPEIARLLTPNIYSELENHPSVLDYEKIKGLNTSLFFVEHSHHEEEIQDGRSHQNQHEAKFVVALCRYLLLQGYKREQITILTTYTGQLYCLRKLMPACDFSGVKVCVVDKYQGEENDIVLLSLVRSNLQGKVGFLNIPNRVCVALSRAKKGLYCLGNSVMLSQVKLWANIFHTLREEDQVGKALTLCCQNHPERQIQASSAEDFKQAPEGGCTQPCEFRLDCGHVCASVCHPYDPEHLEYKCSKPCQKTLCDQGHKCTLVCHEKCPKKCPVKVPKLIPKCQHTQMVPCYQDPARFSCQEPCQKQLQCGHPCTLRCGDRCTPNCMVKVILDLKCGHCQEDACFYKTQKEDPLCNTPCDHQLKCGHACQGSCGKCFQGRFHSPCLHPCKRLLVCAHECKEPCTGDCPPCRRPCENCCVHSKCKKRCGQACAPCKEPCAWQCRHQSCSKLCHEPCDRPPCTQPCDKILNCGHPCIGLCGDTCPNKCRICNHEEVTEILFGTEDEPDARFIQLEDCGHIFECTAMDGWMEDQANDGEQVAVKLKECPRCRTPIRKNLRYGSCINRSLAEIEMVKEKINGWMPDIKERQKTLKKHWIENRCVVSAYQSLKFLEINANLEKTQLTANQLWVLENQLDFDIRVGKLAKISQESMPFKHGVRFRKRVEEFQGWLSDHHQKFTDQQVFDLQRELQRLNLLAQLNAVCHMAEMRKKTEEIEADVQKIRDVLDGPGQLSEQAQDGVKEALKELNKKIPLTGLGISEEDRQMIVSAMKMPPGHWNKCPNGHVYLITECGGAMETRQCPDCDATIGGENHRLDSSNQVASEMDGARHTAWSEANNLLNFDEFAF